MKNYSDLGLLFLRVTAGLFMAFGHGLGKIPPSDGLITGTEKLGFPLPVFFAWMAGISEFFGGLLIAAGLFTRPTAFLWIRTMLTAAFIRHADDPFSSKYCSKRKAHLTKDTILLCQNFFPSH